MALFATHIRFALDLKDQMKVKELDEYVSGTIYPDSRYITKLNRKLTHDIKFTKAEFYQDNDFKKGWAAHLICDKAQKRALTEIFADLFKKVGTIVEHGNDTWILLTALKILEDINDFQIGKVRKYIKHIDYFDKFSHNNLVLIKKYNKIIRKTLDRDSLQADHEYRMFLQLGLDDKLLKMIKNKTEELCSLPKILNRISIIYDKTRENAI